MKRLWLAVLSWRLLNALLSRSFFQPDEYWQSLEIAHAVVYKYGYKTWEWRITKPTPVELATASWLELISKGGHGGIRSPLHPMLFVPILWAFKQLGLDDTRLLTYGPRLQQAVFAAVTDYAVYKLTKRVLSPRHAKAALLCSLTSFFHFQALTRTFSNSVETTLTACALALWPWPMVNGKQSTSGSLKKALWLAALACIMRPSNAVIWAQVGVALLFALSARERKRLVMSTTKIGLSAMTLSTLLDSWYFGTFTITPVRFLQENVFKSISLFYGSNPFHFYLSQGLPITLMTQFPFVLHGIWLAFNDMSTRESNRAIKTLANSAMFTIAVYSLLSHKEWRFIHPLLPMLHVLASLSLIQLADASPAKLSRIQIQTQDEIDRNQDKSWPIKKIHLAFMSISLLPALYLTTFHGIAQVTVMEYLRQLPSFDTAKRLQDETSSTSLRSVAILMPCHSTPWQSHLHRADLEMPKFDDGSGGSGEGGKLWFITCEPPVLGQDIKTYKDQSDVFYDSPSKYLINRFPTTVDSKFPPSPVVFESDAWRHEWPSHIVAFQSLLDLVMHSDVAKNLPGIDHKGGDENKTIKDLLYSKGYRERKRLWNSLWHEDDRRRGDVVVLEWNQNFRQ
ncbi:glycosylphosphatidylinositol anchor biosynthesis [Microbotryomycetes sp. JL221]|nr:glycosylphosphatidylinositol anchor biosynthesis [Microbotryomycetes sp. JL221]